jgi:hypothetical protein
MIGESEGAATNIERTSNARCLAVTAPMALVRNRGRTLDCSTLTPDGSHHAPSHRRAASNRSANGSVAEGRFVLDSRGFGHHVDLDEGGLLVEAIW